ncbi:YhgE/Pip family protein [Candidatus Mycobacterium methanotrophicum]|uniref:YhgE/Pip family protein n=1 Tax=Candidatus Mycobacterium methanotrophicum TaxID=2943498 RepID=A0ABY4QMR7_9MYCO|nr:YhgE/Pip family protein [Candidatus Mycobacterium methanotrophicum]UQX11899.1 YhgE/Pip family protein [Candidatus Mycobacterium methanotrophicum]
MTALRLAVLEFRRFRRPLRWLVPVGLLLIPLLYGSLYLWANWDPYGRTSQIPVAVVDQDRPAVANGQMIDAGKQFSQQLRALNAFQWHFTDERDAHDGLVHGRYYFTITIPADFSEKLASAQDPVPERASMAVTLNDANNFIAGIVAQAAKAELQERINSAAHSAYASALYTDLSQVKQQLKIASDGAHRLVDGTALAQQGSAALTQGIDAARSGATSIDSGATQVQSVNAAADAAFERVIDLALTLIPQNQPGTDEVRQALLSAKNLSHTLTTGAGQVVDGAKQISAALQALDSGSRVLQSGADQSNSGAIDIARVIDDTLRKVPDTNPQQTATAADVLGSPVGIKVDNLNPAHEYGRGFAPFFFAIALWVVGLLAYLFFRPVNLRALAGRVNALAVAVAGWLPVATLTAVGGLILLGVVWVGLRLDPKHPLWMAGLLVVAAGAFVAIDHFLRIAFGVIGSALSLALLIIQLTSCGGLYPMETTPAPFRAVHPLIPMTYLVDGLRVAVSGGLTGNMTRDAFMLAAFLVVFVGATARMVQRQRLWTLSRLHPEIETI